MSTAAGESDQRWAHPSVLDECLDGKMTMITDILKPVVTTMCLVLWLTWSLSESNAFNPMREQTSIATIAYHEQATDSTGTKLTGALLNALAFVFAVGLMTFAIVGCFKYRCFKLLYCMIGMSALSALGSVSQLVIVNLLDTYRIPTDSITFYYIIWNFAVVGMVAIFTPSPGWMKHGYLIAMSVFIAHIFAGLPQWTGWAVLGALVLYDLAAVLCPHGPLNMLVEQAQEQNATIPGLLYEIDGAPEPPPAQQQRAERSANQAGGAPAVEVGVGAPVDRLAELEVEVATSAARQHDEELGLLGAAVQSDGADGAGKGSGAGIEMQTMNSEHSNMDGSAQDDGPSGHTDAADAGLADVVVEGFSTGEGGLKLGLGDFIFYSVLVAGAATDTAATTAACFIGIIFGMVGTIMLLAIAQKALPALPISLTVGIALYFIFSGFAASDASLVGKVGAFS